MNNALQIIFEDDNILVIDKPAGVVVNSVESYKGLTLQDLIREKINVTKVLEDSEFRQRSGIVHRIDKETSGIVLVAKNETAFIYVEYQYVNQGTQTVRAMVDPTNIYLEQNETDNTVTITD